MIKCAKTAAEEMLGLSPQCSHSLCALTLYSSYLPPVVPIIPVMIPLAVNHSAAVSRDEEKVTVTNLSSENNLLTF